MEFLSGISEVPRLMLTWPETEKHLKPGLSFVPADLNHSGPFSIILGTDAKVSTLFIIVGAPKRPFTAGKGGLNLGKALFSLYRL